jgi:hypothetical protein
MTAIDLNDRAFLQSLRADAEAQLACPGCSEFWADAYRDIARALDRLDAMWARVEIGQAHIVASQRLGEPIAATPAPAPTVKDSLTTAPAAEPCLALWQAMNEAQKYGQRTDDKLIVKFLREAGYVIAPAAPAPLTDEQIKRMKPVCADFASFRAGVRAMEAIAASKGGA